MAPFKTLSEQTLMNNYVFSMVMREPKRIKPLPERSMKEKFESKGIWLDLYVEDTDGVVYDVEVQTTDQYNLSRRMRYYQGMLDLTFFPAGADYNKMRKSYVIFICSFDPYDKGRYIYTFQNRCDQNHELLFGDDAVKVVVNTTGTKGEISSELKEAIVYLDREEVTGPYSRELDNAVTELKSNEERGQEYMMLSTYVAEQRVAAKYTAKVELIRKWMGKQKRLSIDEAADTFDVSVSQFEGVIALIKEHPDWDDADIADKADWRQN